MPEDAVGAENPLVARIVGIPIEERTVHAAIANTSVVPETVDEHATIGRASVHRTTITAAVRHNAIGENHVGCQGASKKCTAAAVLRNRTGAVAGISAASISESETLQNVRFAGATCKAAHRRRTAFAVVVSRIALVKRSLDDRLPCSSANNAQRLVCSNRHAVRHAGDFLHAIVRIVRADGAADYAACGSGRIYCRLYRLERSIRRSAVVAVIAEVRIHIIAIVCG